MTFGNGLLIFHFITCTGIVSLVHVNCEESMEVDYELENNSSSYDYEEESTVERLRNEAESQEEAQQPSDSHVIPLKTHIKNIEKKMNAKMLPLFDKDGKKVKSQEIYEEVHKAKIEKMYYDSEGRRVTIPILLRDEDFHQANLTMILDWIQWVDDMRATLSDMKEKASSCKPQSNEEVKGYSEVSVMLKDIQNALHTLDECENKLNKHLRDPVKEWNYPSDKQS